MLWRAAKHCRRFDHWMRLQIAVRGQHAGKRRNGWQQALQSARLHTKEQLFSKYLQENFIQSWGCGQAAHGQHAGNCNDGRLQSLVRPRLKVLIIQHSSGRDVSMQNSLAKIITE